MLFIDKRIRRSAFTQLCTLAEGLCEMDIAALCFSYEDSRFLFNEFDRILQKLEFYGILREMESSEENKLNSHISIIIDRLRPMLIDMITFDTSSNKEELRKDYEKHVKFLRKYLLISGHNFVWFPRIVGNYSVILE